MKFDHVANGCGIAEGPPLIEQIFENGSLKPATCDA